MAEGGADIKVSVDAEDALKALKAIKNEAREATKALKELEGMSDKVVISEEGMDVAGGRITTYGAEGKRIIHDGEPAKDELAVFDKGGNLHGPKHYLALEGERKGWSMVRSVPNDDGTENVTFLRVKPYPE